MRRTATSRAKWTAQRSRPQERPDFAGLCVEQIHDSLFKPFIGHASRLQAQTGRWSLGGYAASPLSAEKFWRAQSTRTQETGRYRVSRHCLLPSSEQVSVVSRDLQIRAKQWKPRPSSPHPPPSPSQSERVGCGMDADGPTTQELASRMGEGTEEEQWVGKLTNLRIASYGLELCLHCRILPHRICGAL